jgi:hypothetical protein
VLDVNSTVEDWGSLALTGMDSGLRSRCAEPCANILYAKDHVALELQVAVLHCPRDRLRGMALLTPKDLNNLLEVLGLVIQKRPAKELQYQGQPLAKIAKYHSHSAAVDSTPTKFEQLWRLFVCLRHLR